MPSRAAAYRQRERERERLPVKSWSHGNITDDSAATAASERNDADERTMIVEQLELIGAEEKRTHTHIYTFEREKEKESEWRESERRRDGAREGGREGGSEGGREAQRFSEKIRNHLGAHALLSVKHYGN